MNKTVITPHTGNLKDAIKELYQYRELLFMFAYRDFRVKYAQLFLGVLWAFLNPLISLFLLTFVFQMVAQVSTGPFPPLVFTVAGLCGWTYFAEVFTNSGEAILGAQQMVKKIYFPRLILPLSKAVTALIDLIVVVLLLFILMAVYRFPPSANLLFFPLFLFMAIITGLAGGIWMSALTIRYRDFRFVGPMLLRVGMFLTPVAYPAAAVPDRFLLLFYLNPLAGIVEGMRWSLIGGTPPHWYSSLGLGIGVLLFLTGFLFFKKVEHTIADII